jgi:hypothetical protein
VAAGRKAAARAISSRAVRCAGPNFGPKRRGTRYNGTAPGRMTDGEKHCISAHNGTGHDSMRQGRATFKTGALNHSATLPSLETR